MQIDQYTLHCIRCRPHVSCSDCCSALLLHLLQSGKLVQKMFGKIHEMIADKDALVCVLIDEVESLTAARKSAMAGSEPSDAIRVVNALLTQIDQIRRCVYIELLSVFTSNSSVCLHLPPQCVYI